MFNITNILRKNCIETLVFDSFLHDIGSLGDFISGIYSERISVALQLLQLLQLFFPYFEKRSKLNSIFIYINIEVFL